MPMLILQKIDFKTINIMREWDHNFRMIKGSVNQEGMLTITNVNIYNSRASKYTKQNRKD